MRFRSSRGIERRVELLGRCVCILVVVWRWGWNFGQGGADCRTGFEEIADKDNERNVYQA